MTAIIFDFDGTLGDTLALCVAAFRKAVEPLAGQTMSDKEIIDTFGPSEEGTIRALVPDEKFQEGLEAYWKWYRELHAMCPKPFEGMKEILDGLREQGVFVGMVTGKGKVSADISLERFGLEKYFVDSEYGWEFGPRKPEGIRALLERNGLDAAKTMYVGDSPSDVGSARKAGVGIIAAAWAEEAQTEVLRRLEPDYLCESVGEFGRCVAGVTGRKG